MVNTHFSLPPLTSGSPSHLRGLPKPHGAICPADNLPAGTVHELGQPANAAHKETRIDVEENNCRVAIRIPPVSHESGLEERGWGYSAAADTLMTLLMTLPWGPPPSRPLPTSLFTPEPSLSHRQSHSLPTLRAESSGHPLPDPSTCRPVLG